MCDWGSRLKTAYDHARAADLPKLAEYAREAWERHRDGGVWESWIAGEVPYPPCETCKEKQNEQPEPNRVSEL